MQHFDFAGRGSHFGSNWDSMERWSLSLTLQDTLRSLETTKFTCFEGEKMCPKVMFKFQRRTRQVLVTITYRHPKTHIMFCWFSGVSYAKY